MNQEARILLQNVTGALCKPDFPLTADNASGWQVF
jgi:hypothetical protein